MEETLPQINLKLRLLTYNVFVRPPGIRTNYNDFKDERLECLISTELNAERLNKAFASASGVPYTVYSVDKDRFPSIPYLSPWRSPRPPKIPAPSATPLSPDMAAGHSKFTRLDTSIIGQFDICCFQELFSSFSYRQRRFLERAKTQGFVHTAASPHPPYLRSTYLVDGGLVVISKYPIVEQDYQLYAQGVDSDMLASKGALYTKIEIEKQKQYLHLFSTHMQASYQRAPGGIPDENLRNDSVRVVQMNQLREFIHDKTKDDKHPIILAGDLNVNSRTSDPNATSSAEYREMVDLLCTRPTSDNSSRVKLFELSDWLTEDTKGIHPPTVGDTLDINGTLHARETALTGQNDLCCMKRLDYILQLHRVPASTKNFTMSAYKQQQETNQQCRVPGSTRVEPFFIEGFPFSQLSDHYGVSTSLKFDINNNNM
ncbi:hypothetical protein SAMD00019534_088260 [Acytostelium subglobosum LB1]|uniref:hypothetical protein n=1 Tax=Acytostelium subglobosum LB1 TaxID=1410327 RepID=UPI00064489F3|nr:hypothetical protein SAMD00019534_088260 [Acytostelium subglobosum LB1]GAM25651.1 hypothetical protein SAMD00019534_088260 [Acytostelium subglobosum LB1]|eukprot:XP_012751637.1 hypothetical protein SAMD00019534_088260 [Acytostelium subglobosum LB1]